MKNSRSQTENNYNGLLVIIPTRNRADLARNAIMSVLKRNCSVVRSPYAEDVRRDNGRGVEVLVSDNSSDELEIAYLESFVKELQFNYRNVRYIKAPVSMPMTAHWDWVIQRAMSEYPLNHFTYLTDRMVFKEGQLQEVIDIANAYPCDVVSYDHDMLDDYSKPYMLVEKEWTGRLCKSETSHLLQMASIARLHPLPKMLNCIVPRAILELMVDRYGNVFDSLSPDYNFAFRCLDLLDYVIYYDKSLLLHYAISRSNGASTSRGFESRDSADFKMLSPLSLSASPWPDIHTIGNAILHEYCVVRSASTSRKFPAINKARFIDYFSLEAERIVNPRLRGNMLEVIGVYKQQEWYSNQNCNTDVSASEITPGEDFFESASHFWLLFRALKKYLMKRRMIKLFYRNVKAFRLQFVDRALLFAVLRFGIGRPACLIPTFVSVDEAIEFASRHPKTPIARKVYLDRFLGGEYLDISRLQ